ncbi:pentatricopeptide repeat-containing protein, mitochondrial [Cocos nucifera]|uniref:Pentatricopeptide repeat-containing protein, mitochondrial n=1 Tax=Cocos nucifera TaxID=13894 RepID=A0A8K0I3R7_COCNU|nr:pentatricopeptide repeat-containing protein, mitochondrial [Cocos nucifera]
MIARSTSPINICALTVLRSLHTSPPPPTSKAGFAAILRSASNRAHLKQIHALLLTTGLSHKNSLLTQLFLSLISIPDMAYARHLLDDMHKPRVFLWNTLIRAYARTNLPGNAIALYHDMRRLGVRPDNFTFPFVLKACADLLDVWLGMAIHSLVIKFRLVNDAIVQTELMIMYAKLGACDSAENIFESMSSGSKDLVAWNALISSLTQNGRADKALRLFHRMESAGMKPDSITLVSAISSCAYLGCLERGRRLHRRIKEEMLESNVFVENALLDMYAKCGSMEEASKLFGEMQQKSIVSWSIMIGGYAVNGDSQRALSLFSRMQDEGVQPNHVTYLAVLSACSHAGLVGEGKEYFSRMLDPKVEHYATMVDLLGRSGHLEEAHSLIKSMPIEPDAGVWGALLGSCTIYHDLGLGQLAADEVFRLAPEIPSYHVLLSNIYAASGRWDDVEKVRENMRGNHVRKVAAYSSVELDGEVYLFHEGSHGQWKEIYKKLDEVTTALRGMGYEPITGVVLHDVESEEKEAAVRTHSEKLAIAFSLTRLKSGGTPIRIMKNLRVCNDCHTFFKYVSRALGRDIIMRDKNRFHHFKDGECSCRDFW